MPITLSDILGTRDQVQTPKNQCSCPACTGLDCLQRPRFFAGQLISEVDLNGEIDYILAKQRLHNRYLHGVGTVCGLEVVCNTCDGFVTVRPGYAISPCGDDIIVCQEQPFNVVKAISDCCTSRKNRNNCDPYQPVADAGCTGIEQHWCVTVSYVETPAKPVTPLRPPSRSCSCGDNCGCGCAAGKGSGNGNGNGRKTTSTCGCSSSTLASTTTASVPASCEPTRTLETFQLGVIPDPGNCTTSASLLGGTLFANLLGCFNGISGFTSKLPSAALDVITKAVAGTLPNSGITNSVAYTACCQFRQYVLNLLADGSITHCAKAAAFEDSACPPLPGNQESPSASDPQYLSSVQTNINLTVLALMEAFQACVCHDLLPPCPADPTANCLILACLTIKDGKITDICNFGCRQFAGSFPSFFYWLSVIPIVPLIKRLVTEMCCGTPETRAPGVRELKRQPSSFQRAMMDSNFALPRTFLERIGTLAQKFTVEDLTSALPVSRLNLAAVRGMSVQDAQQALKAHGVTYDVQRVNSASDIPLSTRAFSFFAGQGDHVVLYQVGSNVAEVRSEPLSSAGITELRGQVESLRAEIADLKSKTTPHPTKKKG